MSNGSKMSNGSRMQSAECRLHSVVPRVESSNAECSMQDAGQQSASWQWARHKGGDIVDRQSDVTTC